MPVADASKTKASVDITIGTDLLGPDKMGLLELVRVKDEWMLPSAALLRFFEPQRSEHDWEQFDIGTAVKIALGATTDDATAPVFDGEIVAVEPDFTRLGTTWTFRALNRAHRLMRGTQTRTFLNMSSSQVVSAIVGEHGLSADVPLEGPAPHYDHLLQADESDWAFAWRLAIELGYTIHVSGTKLHFGSATPGPGEREDSGIVLERGAENPRALREFRPRRSAVSQVDKVEVRSWNPESKEAIVGAATVDEALPSGGAPASRTSAGEVPQGPPSGTSHWAPARLTARVFSDGQASANTRARAMLDGLEAGRVEGDGIVAGMPDLKAGVWVGVSGCGEPWKGPHQLTRVEHVYRATGFETHFTVGGAAPRTLLDIVRGPQRHVELGDQLVVGVVTDTKDAKRLGRVKVKLPTLGAEIESTWARIASLGLGPQRGVFMGPQRDDEVLVAFESGDVRRPIILGGLFNGRDRPHADHVHADPPGEQLDGSLVMRSDALLLVETKKDQKVKSVEGAVTVESKGDNTTKTDGNVWTEAGRNVTTTARGNVTTDAKGRVEVSSTGATTISGAQGVTVESNGSITIRAAGALTLQGAQVNIRGQLINLG